jgi:hypothetical protein
VPGEPKRGRRSAGRARQREFHEQPCIGVHEQFLRGDEHDAGEYEPPHCRRRSTRKNCDSAISTMAGSIASMYQPDHCLCQASQAGVRSTSSGSCTTSWTPGTARPIGTYGFIAQACNATGCSTSHSLTVAVQEDTTTPPPIGSIWASPNPSTTGNYTVQWTAVSGASYYKLYEKDNGVEQGVIQNGASLSWSPSSPRATGDYDYWVKACKVLVNGTHVCSVDSSVYVERVRLPGVPTTPGWIGFSPTNNGNSQVVCNGTSPRTFTLYWEASSGSPDHYEIRESNHVNGNTVAVTVAAPTANVSLTRSKIPPDTYAPTNTKYVPATQRVATAAVRAIAASPRCVSEIPAAMSPIASSARPTITPTRSAHPSPKPMPPAPSPRVLATNRSACRLTIHSPMRRARATSRIRLPSSAICNSGITNRSSGGS